MSHSVTTEQLCDFVSKSLTKVLKTMFWAECELIGSNRVQGLSLLTPSWPQKKMEAAEYSRHPSDSRAI